MTALLEGCIIDNVLPAGSVSYEGQAASANPRHLDAFACPPFRGLYPLMTCDTMLGPLYLCGGCYECVHGSLTHIGSDDSPKNT